MIHIVTIERRTKMKVIKIIWKVFTNVCTLTCMLGVFLLAEEGKLGKASQILD